MSQRLSRAKREAIIIDYLNKKETPGYEVKENANGKFIVKAIAKPVEPPPPPAQKIEIEEEEANEPSLESNGLEEVDYEKPEPKSRFTVDRSKQNARELLRQLSQLLVEEDESQEEAIPQEPKQGQFIERRYKPCPQVFVRRKLILS